MNRKKENKKPAPNPEQMAYERKVVRQRKEIDMKNRQREIDFKEIQLKNNDIQETGVSTLYPGTTSLKNGFKPRFIIQNEIEVLMQQNREDQATLDEIKKLEEEQKNGTKAT